MSNKNLTVAYLYADGHAVLCYTTRHSTGGEVNTVELIENYGPKCNFQGRIIFSNPSWYAEFDIAKKAESITATEPSVEQGSAATRARGLKVGYVVLHFKGGKTLRINILENLLSGPCTYQPEVHEAFTPNAREWACTPVTKIHRAKGGK